MRNPEEHVIPDPRACRVMFAGYLAPDVMIRAAELVHRQLLDRWSQAEAGLARHRTSAFHESHPCGGCHFWQGYQAALTDLLDGRHAFSRPDAGPRPTEEASR